MGWPIYPLSSGRIAGDIESFTGLRLSEKQMQREHRHLQECPYIWSVIDVKLKSYILDTVD